MPAHSFLSTNPAANISLYCTDCTSGGHNDRVRTNAIEVKNVPISFSPHYLAGSREIVLNV